MGKIRDFFKKAGDIKARDIKGTFHARMGTIEDRNDKDVTEAEEAKMRWQEYTKELKLWQTQTEYSKAETSLSQQRSIYSKVHILKAMAFPVVTYRFESWSVKKVERQRTDAFKLWCSRRLLRVPWTAKRSNPPFLKEINPEYSLEGLLLKLQYFSHLMRRVNSLEKTLMLGKIEGK